MRTYLHEKKSLEIRELTFLHPQFVDMFASPWFCIFPQLILGSISGDKLVGILDAQSHTLTPHPSQDLEVLGHSSLILDNLEARYNSNIR